MRIIIIKNAKNDRLDIVLVKDFLLDKYDIMENIITYKEVNVKHDQFIPEVNKEMVLLNE